MRIDWLWFLGYDLDDEISKHSVLSKARKRCGVPLLRHVFIETLRCSIEAGLVSGEKIHIDSSLINADASRHSFVDLALREAVVHDEAKLDEPISPASEEKEDGKC